VKSFAELRAKQRSGQLSVRTTPPQATVWVDGQPAGRGPVRLQLPWGEHFVAVGQIGETAGRVVKVGEESAVSLDARQAESRWRELGQRAGATWIVVVQLSREGRRTRIRARALPMRAGESPRVLASALVDERQLGGAADELAARLAARLAPAPVAPPPPPPPRRRTKLLRAWWFWTAVIVVVAGVATAAVVATRDRDPRVQLVLER
jgi:hypothetical protein